MFFSAAGRGFRGRIASAESRQAPGSLVADKPGERLPDQSSLLFDTGVLLGLPDQFVVEGDGCAHGKPQYADISIISMLFLVLAADILKRHPHLVAAFTRNLTHGKGTDSGAYGFAKRQKEKLCSGRVETGRTELSFLLG
jgi:hypothetical protein